MKKLVKNLDKFEKIYNIKLSKWTRELLYVFLTDLIIEIRDRRACIKN